MPGISGCLSNSLLRRKVAICGNVSLVRMKVGELSYLEDQILNDVNTGKYTVSVVCQDVFSLFACGTIQISVAYYFAKLKLSRQLFSMMGSCLLLNFFLKVSTILDDLGSP